MTETRLQTLCLLVLTTLALAIALHLLSAVMIPFVLAVFVAFAINPAVDLLTGRAKVPRPLAVAGVFLMGFVLFTLVGALVSSSVSELAANADVYQQKITQLAGRAVSLLPLERLGVGTDALRAQVAAVPIGSVLIGVTNAIIEVLSNAVLVLIFVVFLLIGGSFSRSASPIWREIQSQVERYLVTKVAISAFTGTLVGVILYALGVDLALVFGFLAFLLNFIPSVGSVIATLLPLPIVLVSPEGTWWTALLVLALPGGVQFIVGSVIEPKVVGESLSLHPIVILLALIFWGILWGIVGMLLATPITAVIRILLSHGERTRPLARMLAGEFGEPQAEASS